MFDPETDLGKKLINKIEEVIVGGPDVDYQGTTIKSWLEKKPATYISDNKKVVTYDFCRSKDVKFEVVPGTAANPKLKNQRGLVMRLSCKSSRRVKLNFSLLETWRGELQIKWQNTAKPKIIF